jgi:hypothetical protein
MKVATWKGCKDCPYLIREYCVHIKQTVGIFDEENPSTLVIPRLPHPNCKLPDLPSEEEIRVHLEDKGLRGFARNSSLPKIIFDYILNKINGS